MSLLIAARYRDGVLLSSDPFVFDNDGRCPRRRVDFERFFVAGRPCVLFASVGAVWVFRRFCDQLDEAGGAKRFDRRAVGSLWKSLCGQWKADRTRELSAQSGGSLRPVSDSLLVAVPCTGRPRIAACDAAGRWMESRTFVVTGSAACWVHEHLADAGNRFQPRDSLEECLSKVQACFVAGACDLFVVGLPAVAIVTRGDVLDMSATSREVWQGHHAAAFESLREHVSRAADAGRAARTIPARTGVVDARAHATVPAAGLITP